MNRFALILSLAVPLSALAQYPYPPPPPPPPLVRVAPHPYAQPQVYVAPRSPPLSPFYVNLGIGGGWAGLYDPYGFATVGGLAYNVEAGARLTPQLLLGFGLTGLTVFGDPYGGTASTTALDYDVVLTLFPFVHGFFLKGGGGLATLTVFPPFAPGFTHTGANVLLGTGWAFPVAPPLHFTLELDWTRQFFGGYDVTDTSIWMMRVGLGFY
jgi:hypothetical protein